MFRNTRLKNLYYSAIASQTADRAVAEQMRVLYVAMTRAISHLILLCALPDPLAALQRARFRLSPGNSLLARSFLDWVLPAVLQEPGARQATTPLQRPPVARPRTPSWRRG